MILNRIRAKMENVIRKNQDGFKQNRPTQGPILIITRIKEWVQSQNQPVTIIDFDKAFDSIYRQKMRIILSAFGIPSEIVNAIMILLGS